MLHSIQIFTRSVSIVIQYSLSPLADFIHVQDPIEPPTLLAAVLPHLPPKYRNAITSFLVYARMGGMLIDDIAGLVVGLGILIWSAAWVTGER